MRAAWVKRSDPSHHAHCQGGHTGHGQHLPQWIATYKLQLSCVTLHVLRWRQATDALTVAIIITEQKDPGVKSVGCVHQRLRLSGWHPIARYKQVKRFDIAVVFIQPLAQPLEVPAMCSQQ